MTTEYIIRDTGLIVLSILLWAANKYLYGTCDGSDKWRWLFGAGCIVVFGVGIGFLLNDLGLVV